MYYNLSKITKEMSAEDMNELLTSNTKSLDARAAAMGRKINNTKPAKVNNAGYTKKPGFFARQKILG